MIMGGQYEKSIWGTRCNHHPRKEKTYTLSVAVSSSRSCFVRWLRSRPTETQYRITAFPELGGCCTLAGNQSHSRSEYKTDIFLLMEDCSNYEKRIICEQIQSLKTSLRHNRGLLCAQDSFTF